MGLLDDAIREHLDLKRARGADPAEIERMEREALGPVRRDPSIGTMMPEAELETRGDYEGDDYRDDLPEGEHEELVEEVEPPPPKRRFLRRSRGLERSADERDRQTPVDDLEHDEFDAHQELPGHEEPGDDDGHEPATELHEAAEPPQLTFNRPPKRPRFAAEPDSPEASDRDDGDDIRDPADSDDREAAAAASGPGHEPHAGDRDSARHHHDLQPTHEFDVEGAFEDEQERTQGDNPEPSDAGSEESDEDVLEETPEFLQDTPEHDRLWFEQRPPKDFDFDN